MIVKNKISSLLTLEYQTKNIGALLEISGEAMKGKSSDCLLSYQVLDVLLMYLFDRFIQLEII